MNRGLLIASVIVAAAAAAAISVRACADTATPAGSLEHWQAGTNYTLIAKPQPPNVARGKVEVIEVFWYGCGHCYKLDPTLESWKQSKAPYIEFSRVHVIWGPVQRQHAKLFYVLQALGRTDLHTAVFDTIHLEGNMLAAYTDDESRALHKAFLLNHGVTEKAFDDAYDSMSVATNLARAEQLTKSLDIASVPLVVVNGKYMTSVSEAGGAGQLIALINDLAASEKSR
jgi:protein dithiol oxidoreductase (disulfide-forming)